MISHTLERLIEIHLSGCSVHGDPCEKCLRSFAKVFERHAKAEALRDFAGSIMHTSKELEVMARVSSIKLDMWEAADKIERAS